MVPPIDFPDEDVCEAQLAPEFANAFSNVPSDVQDELLGRIEMLQKVGSRLVRPYADKLDAKGSAMEGEDVREIRAKVDRQQWRVLYVFEPDGDPVLLTVASKSGFASERKFYRDQFRDARSALTAWRHSKSKERIK